jgi:hypothetical protein
LLLNNPFQQAANPDDPLAAVAADATPVDESSEEPAATPVAVPEVVTPPTVEAVQKTSGALHLNANISPLLVWAVAGTGGAILAIF